MLSREEDTNLSARAAQTLLRMVERQEKVKKLTNPELSQVLIDLTEEHRIDSYFSQVMMEAAERLSPELFDEADKESGGGK